MPAVHRTQLHFPILKVPPLHGEVPLESTTMPRIARETRKYVDEGQVHAPYPYTYMPLPLQGFHMEVDNKHPVTKCCVLKHGII